MSTHKHIDRICISVIIAVLVLTILFMNGRSLGITAEAHAAGYENRLFDTTSVHKIDIVMDDWDSFIENCENEEYEVCSAVIDGEAFKNIGIRAKGNTSLSNVKSLGSQRYSFKIEFDQYESGKSYHGLDKLCLNNLIQDNTMMKDYLVYQMMAEFGVNSPLCSFAYITVNGEDWGLYLAVEGVEDAFLTRNYGNDPGELYKPDSSSFGGGRGNGRDFDMEKFNEKFNETDASSSETDSAETDADSSATVKAEGNTPP
ncbi:MAG: CotH kinase family protein, partial [Eubacterium sp.]|nr:CotH kinase family protein [Eubacterium sp.]